MSVVISGTGVYTPKQSINNKELVQSYNQYADSYNERHKKDISDGIIEALTHSNEDFIKKVSGIESRYVLDKEGILDPERMRPLLEERSNDEPSVQAEIAVSACLQALENANKKAEDVDAVICACANLQRAYPAIAIEIQDLLGIEGYAYDMNVACSSSTFGIQNAVSDISAGLAKSILVVSPEICSGHLNFKDRDGHFIFGDVCTAILIENEEGTKTEGYKIISTKLKTAFSNNIRNNFGFLNQSENSDLNSPDKLFIQEGRKVFRQVVPIVSSLIEEHLEENNISIDTISRFWLHQANLGMNQLIAKKLLGRDPKEKEMPIVLNEYANTSSAGSIIAFHKFQNDLIKNDIGVICSFGAGYSVGSIIVQKS
ncbi:uncharacterized protein METZ01_LOCUS178567 [marine metagenome]|uniref:Beta-ketoacyl-ACP synthase III n=1 Tax=marine metagenome TaxID=408172 RepID=A0A382CK48_9ZZZZ